MKNLDPHLRAVFSILAFFMALVFLQGAVCVNAPQFGNFMYLLGVSSLMLVSVFFGLRWQGLAFPAMVPMCTTFGLISVYTGMTWMIRRYLLDLQASFAEADVRNSVILFVILPLVVASIILPSIIRKIRAAPPAEAIF